MRKLYYQVDFTNQIILEFLVEPVITPSTNEKGLFQGFSGLSG